MANIEYTDFVQLLPVMSSPDYAADKLVVRRNSDGAVMYVVPNTLVQKASTTGVLTGTETLTAVTPDALAALWEQGSDIASAGTITIGAAGYFHVTGTTGITDIDFTTDKTGRTVKLVFDDVLTLTHSSTLILPTGANITTSAGDVAWFTSEGTDIVRCVQYSRADGSALVSGGISGLTTNVIPKATSATTIGNGLLSSNTTDVSPTAAGTIGLGTNALPFTGIYIGNAATQNILLTGTASGGAKTVTLPNLTGTAVVAPAVLTANRFPYATSSAGVANSPFTWDGFNYVWNSTAMNSEYLMRWQPEDNRFRVGDYTTTATYYLDLNDGTTKLTTQTFEIGMYPLGSGRGGYIGSDYTNRRLNLVGIGDNSYTGQIQLNGGNNGSNTTGSVYIQASNIGMAIEPVTVGQNGALKLGAYILPGPASTGNGTYLTVDDASQFYTFQTLVGGIARIGFKIDASTTAGDTRMLVWDVDNGTLERVSVGAADSGGTGYKLLRIAN